MGITVARVGRRKVRQSTGVLKSVWRVAAHTVPLMKTALKSYNPELRLFLLKHAEVLIDCIFAIEQQYVSVCLVGGLHLLHSHLILHFQDPEHTQEEKAKPVNRGSLRLYPLLIVPHLRLTVKVLIVP